MTARTSRLLGLATTGALLTGVMAAPPVLAASGASSSDDPVFFKISSSDLPGGTAVSALRTARGTAGLVVGKVAKSKGEQILQSLKGRSDIGADGIGVATGPKHVLQVGATGANTYAKSTGKKVKSQTLNELFGIGSGVDLSDPAVAYDPVGKRWVIVAVTDDGGDIGIAVRVSKKSAPTSWFGAVRYADIASDDTNPDVIESMLRLGVTADKVVITAVADDPNDTAVTNRIFFLPKKMLYNNADPDAWAADLNDTYDGQAPAVNASSQANAFVAVPDTSDISVTTYTGGAKANPPAFSKSVMYPNSPLVAPPLVDQVTVTLDLGPLALNSVAWRAGKLWAAAAVECPASGLACVRAFGISTKSGVTLTAQETLKPTGHDLFSPSVAIDGAGYVHLAATDVASGAGGPSFAVFARKGAKKWTGERFVKKATGEYNGPGANPDDWFGGTAAAIDPTSPWDVWTTGAIGTSAGGLTTKVARVSLAENVASIKASDHRVNKGRKVTFTAKLSRPGGDVIKGLPISLQKKPVHGGHWNTVSSDKTSAKGVAKWTLKIKKAALYRTYSKGAQQVGGEGKVFGKVKSKATKVSLN